MVVAAHAIHRPEVGSLPSHVLRGFEDWIVPHVRADVEALGATLDVIAGRDHIGSFFGAAEQVLSAVAAALADE